MSSWNGLDFIILIIFTLNTVLGMSRGAMKEMVSMLSLSAALIIMIRFTVPLANFFNSSPLINNMVSNEWTQNFMNAIGAGPMTDEFLKQVFYSISLLICFVGTFSICEAGMAKTGFVGAYSFPFAYWDTKVGGMLGFVRGYVINLILLLILILHLFKNDNLHIINPSFFTGSFFAKLYQNAIIKLDSLISGQNPDQYQQIFKDRNLYSPEELEKQLNSGIAIPLPPSQRPNQPPPGPAVPAENTQNFYQPGAPVSPTTPNQPQTNQSNVYY